MKNTLIYSDVLLNSVKMGDLKAVAILCKVPALIGKLSSEPVIVAVQLGHTEIVKLLTSKGFEFQSVIVDLVKSCIENNHYQILEYLLEEEDVNASCYNTLFRGALDNENIAIISLYKKLGGDISSLGEINEDTQYSLQRFTEMEI